MTKGEFKAAWIAMYRVGNYADSDYEWRQEWTHPAMAGVACCKLLDQMANEMVRVGVLTQEEMQSMYDSL
jgi:hypothetical protein